MDQNLVAAKRTVNWTLHFLNIDFNKISKTDLFTLWAEIRERAYGEQGSSFFSDESLLRWEERKKQGEEIQTLLRDFLDKALNLVSLKPPRRIMRLPGQKFFVSAPGQVSGLFEVKVKMVGDKLFPFFLDVGDKLLCDFVAALKYFRISLIRKCGREDCGAYFLKATKKEKRYCSKRCAWIVASRERWESQPEVEKEKRREYYQRKKRGEVAINEEGTKDSSPSSVKQEVVETRDAEGQKIPRRIIRVKQERESAE